MLCSDETFVACTFEINFTREDDNIILRSQQNSETDRMVYNIYRTNDEYFRRK